MAVKQVKIIRLSMGAANQPYMHTYQGFSTTHYLLQSLVVIQLYN